MNSSYHMRQALSVMIGLITKGTADTCTNSAVRRSLRGYVVMSMRNYSDRLWECQRDKCRVRLGYKP